MNPTPRPQKTRSDKGMISAHVLAGRNHCACGRMAFKKKCASWVCPRCDEIEERYYAEAGHYGKCGFSKAGI